MDDKVAGRHGNKGIISKVLPRQVSLFLVVRELVLYLYHHYAKYNHLAGRVEQSYMYHK